MTPGLFAENEKEAYQIGYCILIWPRIQSIAVLTNSER